MKTMTQVFLTTLCILICGVSATAQQTSAQGEFSLQGRLTAGASNEAITDGTYSLIINIYEAGTATVVATEADVVTTVDGVFSTMIGDNSSLSLEAEKSYEIGIAVENESELSPRITLGSAPSAITANLAANAETVGGLRVSTSGEANTIVATSGEGRIDANLLSNSIKLTGSGASMSTEGGFLNLNISGGGSGSFELPFTGVATVGAGASALEITAMGQGSAATFLSTGTGSALELASNTSGSAALDITNSSGAAVNAVGSLGSGAVVQVQNTSSNANAGLIAALNASGEAAFEVKGTGQTVINSTVGNALEVRTSAAGETALKVVGGLALDGPAGTATLEAGATSLTVNNALVNANSIIMLTVNSATSLTNSLRVSGQANGSFTVSLLNTALGALNGDVKFNYLIINSVNQ